MHDLRPEIVGMTCWSSASALVTLALARPARGALLLPAEAPPLLSSPVFSLATRDAAGATNMNILTYATPAGIAPQRMWAVSLYRKTATYENWVARRGGVLQLLRDAHAPLVYTLGGTSARDADKAAACGALGFGWEEPGGEDGEDGGGGGGELVLPGCEAYLRLEQVGELIPAGEHDLAICRVVAMLAHAGGPAGGAQLSTGALRDANLVTAQGRVVEP